MGEAWETDPDYETHIIRTVSGDAIGGFWVTYECGWGTYYDPSDVTPEPGDRVRAFNYGSFVRGLVIEGKGVVRYATEDEYRVELAERAERHEQEKREREERTRSERDLRIRELPRSLRERIQRFQHTSEDWRVQYEEYELFVCEEAARIAQHFEGVNAVYRLNGWAALSHERQAAELTVSDQHSGNTFGQAVHLARLMLSGGSDDLLIREHGALCPLVGCEDYGCWAATAEAVSR